MREVFSVVLEGLNKIVIKKINGAYENGIGMV
jgi:hypothetical protein